jgi:GxxExxY protein
MNANDFPQEFLNRQQAERNARLVQQKSATLTPSPFSDLLLKDEVYGIVGCAMEVLNELGHGLHEKPYENALVVEFGLRKIPFVQQPCYDVLYKQVTVGEYVPDLIAFGAVVVDAKVIEAITDHERGQMLNYLRVTGHKVGVILNFKHAKLEWERIVLSNQ